MRSPAPPGLQMSPGKSLTTHKDALSYRIAFLWKGVVIKSAAPGRLYLRAGPRFVNNHLCDRTVIDPRARSLSNDVFSNASSTRLNRVSITPSFYPVSCYSGLTDFLCSCIPPLVSPPRHFQIRTRIVVIFVFRCTERSSGTLRFALLIGNLPISTSFASTLCSICHPPPLSSGTGGIHRRFHPLTPVFFFYFFFFLIIIRVLFPFDYTPEIFDIELNK